MLSGPHQKFAEGIASGLNQTRAYMAAYPDASEESARRLGSQLLTNVDVASKVDELQKKVEKEFSMTRAEWLERFKSLADNSEMVGELAVTKACLREIGLAMPGWYAPAGVKLEGDVEINVTIGA
jgi:phage terminase small subunit